MPYILFVYTVKDIITVTFEILFKMELPQKAGYEPSITGTNQ